MMCIKCLFLRRALFVECQYHNPFCRYLQFPNCIFVLLGTVVMCLSRRYSIGKFHRAGKQKKLLSRFHWLPAKLLYKMYAVWLVVCFLLLIRNICLADFIGYQPNFVYKMYAGWLVVCFLLLSKNICLAALWNWPIIVNLPNYNLIKAYLVQLLVIPINYS